MSVKVLLVDLRSKPSLYRAAIVDWISGLTACQVIDLGFNNALSLQIARDLLENNEALIVSWIDLNTGDHSDVGGIGTLDWEIADKSILSIVYEDRIVDEDEIEESNRWLLEQQFI